MERAFPKLPSQMEAFWEWIDRLATLITLAGFAYAAWKWVRRNFRLPNALRDNFTLVLLMGSFLPSVVIALALTTSAAVSLPWLQTHSTETFLARASITEAPRQPFSLWTIVFPIAVIGVIVGRDLTSWVVHRVRKAQP